MADSHLHHTMFCALSASIINLMFYMYWNQIKINGVKSCKSVKILNMSESDELQGCFHIGWDCYDPDSQANHLCRGGTALSRQSFQCNILIFSEWQPAVFWLIVNKHIWYYTGLYSASDQLMCDSWGEHQLIIDVGSEHLPSARNTHTTSWVHYTSKYKLELKESSQGPTNKSVWGDWALPSIQQYLRIEGWICTNRLQKKLKEQRNRH